MGSDVTLVVASLCDCLNVCYHKTSNILMRIAIIYQIALLHNSERSLLDDDFSNSQEWTKYELLYLVDSIWLKVSNLVD